MNIYKQYNSDIFFLPIKDTTLAFKISMFNEKYDVILYENDINSKYKIEKGYVINYGINIDNEMIVLWCHNNSHFPLNVHTQNYKFSIMIKHYFLYRCFSMEDVFVCLGQMGEIFFVYKKYNKYKITKIENKISDVSRNFCFK